MQDPPGGYGNEHDGIGGLSENEDYFGPELQAEMITIVRADEHSAVMSMNGMEFVFTENDLTLSDPGSGHWMEDLWGWITRPWQQPDLTNPEEIRARANILDRRAATWETMARGADLGRANHPQQDPGERMVRASAEAYRQHARSLRDEADRLRRRANELD